MSIYDTDPTDESRPDTFGRSIHDINKHGKESDPEVAIGRESVLRFPKSMMLGLKPTNPEPMQGGKLFSLFSALTEPSDHDAWIAPYVAIAPSGQLYRDPPRLSKRGLPMLEAGGSRVECRWLLIDVDCTDETGKKATVTGAWRQEHVTRLEELPTPPSLYYSTNGGYRIGWRLASPLSPSDYEKFIRWVTGQKTGVKGGFLRGVVVADERCLHWNASFFVPNCVKGRNDAEGKPGRVCRSEWIGLTGSRLDPLATLEQWGKVELGKDRDRTLMSLPPVTDQEALPQGENFPAWLLSRLYTHLDGRARELATLPAGRNTRLYGDAADLGRDVLVIEHYAPGVTDALHEKIKGKLLQGVADGARRFGIEHDPDKDAEAVSHGLCDAEDDPWGQAWLESRLREYRGYVKDAEILRGFARMGGVR